MKKKQLLFLSFVSFTLIIISQFNLLKSQANNHLSQNTLTPEIQEVIDKYNPQKPPRGDVRLLVISDLNSAYGSTEYDTEVHLAVKMIPFWQPDLVLCSGDMIAGQKPSLTATQIRAMWQSFDRNIAQPVRNLKIPFGFTIGNHDGSGWLVQIKVNFYFSKNET